MTQDHKKNDQPDFPEKEISDIQEGTSPSKNGTSFEDQTSDTSSQSSTEEELNLLKDQLLRALAESENIRKRAQREKEDAARFAISNFARDLLAVADNLSRALENIPTEIVAENESLKAIVEGITITERELMNTFERHGVKKISPLGELFDHNYHQAMFEEDTTEYEPGKVSKVLQTGYVLNDRLLRPALVGVAKAK